MFRYRLIYAITLLAVYIFYLAYSPWFSRYLLVLVLVLVPVDLALSLPGMLTKSIKLSAPVFLEKDAPGVLTATTLHMKPYPVRCLYLKLRVTGDDFIKKCCVILPPCDAGRAEVTVDTGHTGLTVFQVSRLRAVSLMGLFSVKIKSSAKASVLVLPPPKKPDNSILLPRSMTLKPKPGGGFSEEHDMRGYLPGDPVRSIHWKLSAKFDSLIIREPLIPPQHSRLIHIMPWSSPNERDNALAYLRWVSGYLTKRDMTHYIKFGNRQLIEEIADEAGLIDFLRRILDITALAKPVYNPRITRFSWVYKVKG